jgi:hypothetical protein
MTTTISTVVRSMLAPSSARQRIARALQLDPNVPKFPTFPCGDLIAGPLGCWTQRSAKAQDESPLGSMADDVPGRR